MECPKCGGEMQPGRLSAYKWVVFNSDSERAKPVGKGRLTDAFRCDSCGYVELYANRTESFFDLGQR
jgi:hypothetical protein